ncbi:MAG TPA: sulfotransferase [Rhizomicrobium sp.]|jgi:hypothetical protein|nr:sulfotransferase [Rhizomicrobium sp.]
MPIAGATGKNVVLVLGAARSGTTWLAKIFDSHPDVIYRHEPDTVLRSQVVPALVSAVDWQIHVPDAREYLLHLLDVRSVKSAGSFPLFPKRFRSRPSEYIRALMIYGEKFAMSALGPSLTSRLRVPDFADRGDPSNLKFVMKSVSSCGRVKVFAAALPESRIVYLVRHPCGQVASMLKGIASGKFERPILNADVFDTDEAQRLDVTNETFQQLDLVEQCAYHWAILNQKAINDLPPSPRSSIVRYRDLCARPREVAEELFRFCALDWEPQSERFVLGSSTAADTDRYYWVERNSRITEQRWRHALDAESQRRIFSICRRVAVGEMFAE